MSQSNQMGQLIKLLDELGVSAGPDRQAESLSGYPTLLTLANGQAIPLDLHEPAGLAGLDTSEVGVAVVEPMGYVLRTWGFAQKVALLRSEQCLLETDLALLIQAALQGTPGALYLNGVRYYASGLTTSTSPHVLLLVTSAVEEKNARYIAHRSTRSTEILKRVGKALTMNQNLQPLCQSAVHEIASAAELAAVLLWVSQNDHSLLRLMASVGANRQGTQILEILHQDSECTCLAELVSSSRRTARLANIQENSLTANLEAKFCYLNPGALVALPLTIGDRLIGVLELIGRDQDDHILEDASLFETVAEHLSLALNSALMFESVERLATNDPLTGIANHRAMQEFLHKRIAEAQRTKATLGVIMLDVDHFRAFNEEEGHDAGDVALRRVANVLEQSLREYDLAARYGGEEFAVIMPNASMETTLMIAERIRHRIEHIEIETASGRVRHLTASLGCAVFPENGSLSETVMKAADTALFKAKRAGRNQVCMYEGELTHHRPPVAIDHSKIVELLKGEKRLAAEARLSMAENYILHLVKELHLSRGQEAILRACVVLLDEFREAQTQDPDRIRWMEMNPELRVIMPTLVNMDERYDGTGPLGLTSNRIPLLARVMAVLEDVLTHEGAGLVDHSHRFDPEIINLVVDHSEAA